MLRTESDLLRTLESGTYTLTELYEHAEQAGLADRPGGRTVIQDGREQYKRRVRSALYALRAKGRARRLDSGEPGWVIDGTPARPRRALLVWLPSDPSQVELVLGKAAEVLARCDEPIDLVFADPAWGLDRGKKDAAYQRTYRRDHDKVMPGYVEVDPAEYADFTAEWVTAAEAALRPGGYLAVVTGPQQAGRVQCIAEDLAGLTYVNSITVKQPFGQYCTRQFVHGHATVTLMTKGKIDSKRRYFQRPAEMPVGRNGHIYAEDVWTDIPRLQRRELLRYDNSLHPALPSRVIRSTTRTGDLVADPFLGGGSTADACLQTGRRFYGGDANPNSLRFTMARLLAEVLPTVRPDAAPPDVDAQLELVFADLAEMLDA